MTLVILSACELRLATLQVTKWINNQIRLSGSPILFIPLLRPLVEKFASTVGVTLALFPNYWGYILAGVLVLILVVWSFLEGATFQDWYVRISILQNGF